MSTTLANLQQSGHLRRVDAALGAWLARVFADAAPDVVLAAALAARAVADGHSALALRNAAPWLAGLGEGKSVALPEVAAWADVLRAASAVHVHTDATPTPVRPLVLDAQGRIYLRRYFEYERQLAEHLIARSDSDRCPLTPTLSPNAVGGEGAKPATPAQSPLPQTASSLGTEGADAVAQSPLPRTASSFGGEGWVRGQTANVLDSPSNEPTLDPAQQRAITTTLAHRFTLVTGGPGTGKTHGVARMLTALAEQAHARGATLHIALAAPTGKAAARLGESLRAQIDTLALPAEIATQIPRDAQTLHRLLGISPWRAQPQFGRATRLPFDVVVVDEVSMVDLPLMAKLVDAVADDARLILLGDPDQLSAVEAGNVLGALVDAARSGALRDCHVALSRSHRFHTDSPLGQLAAAITQGDADTALHALAQGDAVTLAADTRSAVLVEAAANAYLPILAATDPATALHAAHGFRLLTAMRHGPTGCLALDAAINARLQRHAGVRGDSRHWRGRLILITANRAELELFNGDTGVVWPDGDGVLQAWFVGKDGMPRALPLSVLPPHEGAFALTVHKAQGSEFERIALVTGTDSAVLTRELLYTGVTRARAAVTMYATAETLRAGVARRTLRMSGLADRLREAAGT